MLYYNFTFFSLSTFFAAALCAAAYLGMVRGYLSPLEMAALRARLEAIEDATPPDVLFVGDSSLAHAISSETFHRLTGLRALNLALPGVFGYGGSLNMLRRARDRFDIRTVVVMQSVEMASRAPSDLGAALTEPTPTLAGTLVIIDHALGLGHLVQIFRGFRSGVDIDRPFADGFPVQQRTTFDDEVFAASAGSIRPDKLAELAELGTYCRNTGLRCLYVHGPYWDEGCAASTDYIEAVGRAVAAAGLHLLTPQPLCLTKDQLGNAPDHVRPDLKAWTTKLFVDKFGPAFELENTPLAPTTGTSQ